MKKRIVILIILTLLSSLLTACGHEHIWEDATCTSAKTCSECGEIEGDVLSHDTVPASCEAPETCSRCGKTFGKKLEHEWQEASCAQPKTCANCGEIQGTVLNHDWLIPNYETAECSQCGDTINFLELIPELYPISDVIYVDPESSEISFTAIEYVSMLWKPVEYNIAAGLESAGPVYFVMKDLDNYTGNSYYYDSLLCFTLNKGRDDNYDLIQQDDTTSKINIIQLSYSTEHKEDPAIVCLIYDMVYTIDHSIRFEEFRDLFEEMNSDENLDFMEVLHGVRGATQMSTNLAYQYQEQDDRFYITISSLDWFWNDFY